MSNLDFDYLLARSSVGGSVWCSTCRHPELLHGKGGCRPHPDASCGCAKFKPMTPTEWLRWQGGRR